MFVDASALAAILLEEKDFPIFANRLDASDASCITPFVMMELEGGAEAAKADIQRLLRQFRINTVELTSEMILAALQAYERYGKGRSHPAKLNMGDCLSYGAARVLGVPLLYKGEDFAKTDVRSALG
jgi:ribonuclease VapC